MSYTLPSHIEQKPDGWFYDTIKNKYIRDKWIKWYCNEYWKSIDINPITGNKIKRRVKKEEVPFKSKLDWDAYDRVEIKKEVYKEVNKN